MPEHKDVPGTLSEKASWKSASQEGLDSSIYRRVALGQGRVHNLEGESTVGWVTVDIDPEAQPDVVADLGKPDWPFEDSSIHEVFSAHCLEHIEDWGVFFRELYRICAHGAIVRLIGPTVFSDAYWADPTHKRPFTAKFFNDYLSASSRAKMKGAKHTGLGEVDFETKMIRRIFNPMWDGKAEEALSWAAEHNNNVVYELDITLAVHKPIRTGSDFEKMELLRRKAELMANIEASRAIASQASERLNHAIEAVRVNEQALAKLQDETSDE